MSATSLPSPPGLLGAIALHAGLHLRRTLRPRRLWPPLLLIALVALAGGGLARVSAGQPLALLTLLTTLGLRAIGLIALGYGTRALRADADHGALSAFLLRPRAEIALPIGRAIATAAIVAGFAVVLVLAVQLAALAFALPLPWARLPFLLLGAASAGVAYTMLFLLLAALVRPAAAVGLAWLVLMDLGIGNLSSRIGLLTPGPSGAVIMGFDPDLSLFGSQGADLWLAAAALLALSVGCVALTVVRFRGDAPQ